MSDDRLLTSRRLPVLLHPFDDPSSPHVRPSRVSTGDLPDEYNPDETWTGGDLTDLGYDLPRFEFIPGDDTYSGEMRITLDAHGEVVYRCRGRMPYIEIGRDVPRAIWGGLEGRDVGDLLEMPGTTGWKVHWVMDGHPGTSILLLPGESTSSPCFDLPMAA